MMKSEDVLIAALHNFDRERIGVPSWKALIKTPFNAPARESAQEPPEPFSRCFEDRDLINVANRTKYSLIRLLQKYIPGSLSMVRQLENTEDRVFLLAGCVSVASPSFPESAQAEEVAAQWREKGIHSVVVADLPWKPALYSYEVLQDANNHKGLFTLDGERMPTTIENYLQGQEKTEIRKAKRAVEALFHELEGLAVRCYGAFLWQSWDGITLTKAGVTYARSLKAQIEQANKITADFFLLRCWACGSVLFRTNDSFDPAKEPVGSMFDLLPEAKLSFTPLQPDARGEMIQCPACENPFTVASSERGNFLREGVLIPPKELEKAA